MSLTLADLLEVENDSELLSVECVETGAPVWALIRSPFLRVVFSQWLYDGVSMTAPMARVTSGQRLSNIARGYLRNLVTPVSPSADLVFMTTGLGNQADSQGAIFDRLVDDFVGLYPQQSQVIEGPAQWAWTGAKRRRAVSFSGPGLAWEQVQGRLRVNQTHYGLASRIIERAVKRCDSLLGHCISDEDQSFLRARLTAELARLPIATARQRDRLRRLSPKVLFREDACYGGASVPAIIAAKSLGLPVAELQHGAISKGHDAYNFAPLLLDHQAFRRTLPDYLLTYGEWWSAQTNAPLKKVVIGNPVRERQRAMTVAQSRGETDRILILGDGFETTRYLAMSGQIAAARGARSQVVFRPHPLERQRLSQEAIPSGVMIDDMPDIGASLKASSTVISELSTGLFEAVGVVEQILVWETPKARFAFPEIPFPTFSDVEHLLAILGSSNDSGQDGSALGFSEQQLWAEGWTANFQSFMQDLGVTRVQ